MVGKNNETLNNIISYELFKLNCFFTKISSNNSFYKLYCKLFFKKHKLLYNIRHVSFITYKSLNQIQLSANFDSKFCECVIDFIDIFKKKLITWKHNDKITLNDYIIKIKNEFKQFENDIKEPFICEKIWAKLQPHANCKKWLDYEYDHIRHDLWALLYDYCDLILKKPNNHSGNIDLDDIIFSHCYIYASKENMDHTKCRIFSKHVRNFIDWRIRFNSYNYGLIKNKKTQYIYKLSGYDFYVYRYGDYNKSFTCFDLEYAKKTASFYKKNDNDDNTVFNFQYKHGLYHWY